MQWACTGLPAAFIRVVQAYFKTGIFKCGLVKVLQIKYCVCASCYPCPYRDSNSDPSVVKPVANLYTDCAIAALYQKVELITLNFVRILF
jgi:hypothetical protein